MSHSNEKHNLCDSDMIHIPFLDCADADTAWPSESDAPSDPTPPIAAVSGGRVLLRRRLTCRATLSLTT